MYSSRKNKNRKLLRTYYASGILLETIRKKKEIGYPKEAISKETQLPLQLLSAVATGQHYF